MSQYVKNLLFCEDEKFERLWYDMVILEKKPSSDIKNIIDSSWNVVFADNCKDPYGQILELAQKAEHPLLILEQSSVDFLPVEVLKISQLTILNLWTGVVGIGKKIRLEIDDIAVMQESNFVVHEPFDLQSFWELLAKKWKNYMRLSTMYLPSQFFEQNLEIDKGVVSLVEKGFSGLQATILATGSFLPLSTSVFQLLQQEWISTDVFGLVRYWISEDCWDSRRLLVISDDLRRSLEMTEKLFIIVDQKRWSKWEDIVKKSLKNNNLSQVDVVFLMPEYDDVKSVLEEYVWEDVWFDAERLALRIGKLIVNGFGK